MKDFLKKINADIKPKLIVSMVAGSHLYQMNTAESDLDFRIIYKATNPIYVYGLREPKTICTTSEEEDSAIYELSHFIRLMAKTNTQMAEMLFCRDDSLIFCSDEFSFIRENKFKLLDSEKLFKSLSGYLHNERRLTMGERSGQLGGKRKAALEKYGFSYKNAVQFMRLCSVGEGLFLRGEYIVGMKEDPSYELLMDIKTNPGKYSKEKIENYLDVYEKKMFTAHDNKKFTFKFDYELAGEILKKAYS